MALTWTRQVTEIRNSDTYDDTIAPSLANFETNPTEIETDLNNIRSMLSHLKDVQAGNWYDVLATPSTFENGAQRGVDDVNQDLHDLERKRILDYVSEVGKDITVGGSDNFVILGTGELPTNTTANVGGTTATLGTMTAFHAGTFGTHSLDEVAGPNALQPLNRVEIFDASTGDPILSGEREVVGLLQIETNTDGLTITDTTPNRVQISFVRANSTFDDLEACPAADIQGKVINYAYIEQYALQDLPRHAFLGGRIGEAGSSSVTRQNAYDNQGTSIVTQATDAFLQLNSAGIDWNIQDLNGDNLLTIRENSATNANFFGVSADVDLFTVSAATNIFSNGVTANSSGTRPIALGTTDGVIESTAGALEVQSAAALSFDDGNKPGTWSLASGINLSDNSTDWSDFETAFGEVSLLDAIVQAASSGGATRGTKTYADVTASIAADADVGGSGGGTNLDTQLPDMSVGTFLDHDVYVNGRLLEGGADASANNDYYPGTSLALGQLRFERTLDIGDRIAVVTWT